MKKTVITAVIIALVLIVLFGAMKLRAPKNPPATTQEIWASNGIPVETSNTIIGDMENIVEITGDIDALKKATLSAKIPGRVANVYKFEGDSVRQGETIILLDQQDALSNVQQAEGGLRSAIARLSQAKTNADVTKIQTGTAIEQAQASLNSAKAKLAVVKNPARNQDIMVSENRLASAKATLDNKEVEFNRNKQLLEKGAISQSSYDLAKTQYAIAQADYKTAQEQLSLIKEGGRSEDVLQAQSQVEVAIEQLRSARANASQNLLRKEDIKSAAAAVEQARAALSLAKQQLSNTYIKSPISGELSSRSIDSGSVVSPGQMLAEVVDLGSVYLKGEISEKDLANITRGQHVSVSVDAIPDRTYVGVVDEIFPSGSLQSRSFPVRIRIDHTGNTIRPGMFGRGAIVTGVDKNVLLVPKDAVDDRKGSKVVFTIKSKQVKENLTDVKTGKKSTKIRTVYFVKRHDIDVINESANFVEVKLPTALQPGDTVVTSGKQNLQEGSAIAALIGK